MHTLRSLLHRHGCAVASLAIGVWMLALPLFYWRERGFSKALLAGPDEAARIWLKLHWATGVESMMQSALDGERPQRTAVFAPATQIDSLVRTLGRHRLYNPWETRPVDRLDPRCFALDTAGFYQVYR